MLMEKRTHLWTIQHGSRTLSYDCTAIRKKAREFLCSDHVRFHTVSDERRKRLLTELDQACLQLREHVNGELSAEIVLESLAVNASLDSDKLSNHITEALDIDEYPHLVHLLSFLGEFDLCSIKPDANQGVIATSKPLGQY